MLNSFLILSAIFLSTSAQASEATVDTSSSTIGASTATSDVDRSNILDHFYFNLFTIYHGPGLTNLDQPYTPSTADGHTIKKDNYPMNFDNEITMAYMITPDFGIGPDIPFLLAPVLGEGIILGDLGVKVFKKNFVSTRNLNIYTNLILQFATSTYDSSRKETLGVKTTPSIRYSIPDSRYTIGAWTEEKAYLGVNSGKTSKLYASPYVNYQVTPKFSWNLGFEIEADHFYGKPTWDLTTSETDVMPGFVYMVNPKVIVNPYFQIFTGQKVSIQNTALGAIMSASL